MSDNSLNNIDTLYEFDDQICWIRYELLTIEMFRDIYEQHIDTERSSFNFFKMNFFRSCDEIKFYIINFLVILQVKQLHPGLSCVSDFRFKNTDKLTGLLKSAPSMSIHFQEINGVADYVATICLESKKLIHLIESISKSFLENSKQSQFLSNELLIYHLSHEKLVCIYLNREKDNKANSLDYRKNLKFKALLNNRNYVDEILVELITEYFKKERTLENRDKEINSDFINWLLEHNDEFPTLNNLLAQVYISRLDLINSFRQGDEDWFNDIFSWFIDHGWKELAMDALLINDDLTKLLKRLTPLKIENSKGASVISYLKSVKGLGEAAKSYGKAIESLISEVNYADIVFSQDINSNYLTYGELNIIGANGDQLPKFFTNLGLPKGFPTKTIGIWFWELDKLTPNFLKGVKYIDKIWAPTKFNYETFKSALELPIDHVPMPILKTFDFSKTTLIQGKYFINVFDFLSDFNRKNPIAAIDAFNVAFPVDGSGPKLLIKSTNSVFDPQNSKLLARMISQRSDIIWIDEVLPENELNYLIKNSIGLISLHRSEGFGMNIANSMQMMVPTIVTAYSGNMDFCDENNSFLVNFNLVSVETDNVNYANINCKWADPNPSDAANYLLEIYNESEKVDKIVKSAIERISDMYAVERILKLMKKSLRKTKLFR
jgi:glycosyltransferase involved in cell wall biosynthesis